MASDLKIEIFAYDIFSKLFTTLGKIKPSIFETYKDECHNNNTYKEACDMLFYEAVLCRFICFKTIYLKDLTAERIKSLKSLSDCYDYVIQVCDRNDLFVHLNVFERMLSTSAFVITLCIHIYFVDVVNYGHLFWAMYFDKYIETFYKDGGWSEFGRVSESYFMLSWFLDLFAASKTINVMKEASVNYHQFKKSAPSHDYKHVSKQWAKFRINNFRNYIIVPLNYEYSIGAYEADLLFEDLKRLCDTQSENFSEIFKKCINFDSFEEIKTNGDKILPIDYIFPKHKSRINDTYCGKLSESSSELEYSHRVSFSFSNMKLVVPLNSNGNTVNLKSQEKSFFETDLKKSSNIYLSGDSRTNHIPFLDETISRRNGTEIGDLPELIDLNSDPCSENISLNIKNELFPKKHFSLKSVERQIDNTRGLVPFERNGNFSMKNVSCPKCLNPVNKYANVIGEKMDVSKDINDIACFIETSSVDQIVASERRENTLSVHNLYLLPKPFNSSDDCVKAVHERKNIQEGMDDLRNQNNDFGISDFLRLILILDDSQGIEYVRSTMHSSESSCEKLQENFTKHKKRSKKNKSEI